MMFWAYSLSGVIWHVIKMLCLLHRWAEVSSQLAGVWNVQNLCASRFGVLGPGEHKAAFTTPFIGSV